MTLRDANRAAVLVLFGLLALCSFGPAAIAQTSARALISSGSAVPGHPGFTFGPFSGLAMNGRDQIAFRTTLVSSRNQFEAIVKSTGVTFSVVAFQGLVSPEPRQTYGSFSAPSLNSAGVIAFTAALQGGGADAPASAVVRVDQGSAQMIAEQGQVAPGNQGGSFAAFSAPLVGSAGEVLFAARVSGPNPASGLFLWTGQGIKAVPLPQGLNLAPSDLLEPMFFSHDQSVWVRKGTPLRAANDQFFRAVAIQNFQQLAPAPVSVPAPVKGPPGQVQIFPDQVQILPADADANPVQMLMAVLQATQAETAALSGDPSKPVMALKPANAAAPPFTFKSIQGQMSGPRSGTVIFAATPVEQPNEFGIFCYCDGQVNRLTDPQDFSLITQGVGKKNTISFSGDGEHTAALIAPVGEQAGANAIFVIDLP